jgi:hypothetical protein
MAPNPNKNRPPHTKKPKTAPPPPKASTRAQPSRRVKQEAEDRHITAQGISIEAPARNKFLDAPQTLQDIAAMLRLRPDCEILNSLADAILRATGYNYKRVLPRGLNEPRETIMGEKSTHFREQFEGSECPTENETRD